MNAGQMGADMIMNSQGGGNNNKNEKNGNGLIKKAAWVGSVIVSIIVISVFVNNIMGGTFRKDWQIEQNVKTLESVCAEMKDINLKIKKLELEALEQKTETGQRLKTLETTIDKIDNSLDAMKTDMTILKEIDKTVKKLVGN